MTMKRIALFTAALLIASPALAQSVGEKSGVNSTLGIAPTTASFVKEVAISDMFELKTNKLAEERGNAEEKKFAAMMIKDHTKTTEELTALIKSGDVKEESPTQLDSNHQGKLDKLGGYKGDDFTSEFASQQVSAHKDAINLFERYAKGGDNPKLKDWAGKTLPALQHHLEMAQALKK